jgi:hypothetical protein
MTLSKKWWLGAVVLFVAGAAGCGEESEVLEPEACVARGGHVVADPGDGSTSREGCPNGEHLLGGVRFGIEGGICCKP